MLRRHLLTPVICLIIAGLVGASSSVEARTTDTNTRPTDLARHHSVMRQAGQDDALSLQPPRLSGDRRHKADGLGPASVQKKGSVGRQSSKKAAVKKKSGKKTGPSTHSERTTPNPVDDHSSAVSVMDPLLHLVPPHHLPSDLWLARDNPGSHRILRNEEYASDLDKLTLNILSSAYRYLGTPYRFGGTTPNGFDCSGFVQRVFGENGISLGRSSRDQAREGVPVEITELKPGDLIFFNMRPKRHEAIDHVGLYLGNGQFIHAPSQRSREITIDRLDKGSYLNRLVGARRVLEYTNNDAVVIE